MWWPEENRIRLLMDLAHVPALYLCPLMDFLVPYRWGIERSHLSTVLTPSITLIVDLWSPIIHWIINTWCFRLGISHLRKSFKFRIKIQSFYILWMFQSIFYEIFHLQRWWKWIFPDHFCYRIFVSTSTYFWTHQNK